VDQGSGRSFEELFGASYGRLVGLLFAFLQPAGSELSLSADGRSLAYVGCRSELVVRELPGGRERVWTIPPGASVQGPQLSQDGTRLVYQLERRPGEDRLLHLLPLAGTTSVTDGHDLPVAGDCPVSLWRFLDDRRLLALGGRGCAAGHFDNLLVRIDLQASRVESAVRRRLLAGGLVATGSRWPRQVRVVAGPRRRRGGGRPAPAGAPTPPAPRRRPHRGRLGWGWGRGCG
jgi:hypothetical protein